MTESIHFDVAGGSFVLRLKNSVYILRILPGGQVVHVGFAPLSQSVSTPFAAAQLDDYGDASYVWEEQTRALEYPTYGESSPHEVALKIAFPEAPAGVGNGETTNLPVRDVRLRYVSHEVCFDAEPLGAPTHGQPPRNTEPRPTLCLRLKDEGYEFFVTLFYRVTAEHDIIERWTKLENATGCPVEIETVDGGVLNLRAGCYQLLRVAGGWSREFIPVTQDLEQGTFVLDQKGLNTGHTSNPFFLLHERGTATETAGTVYFGALAWSGNWRMRFEVLPSRECRVFAGYEASDFALTLGAGESCQTPACAFGCTDLGYGGASRALHRMTRERVLPGHPPGELRPVLYNSWEATGFDLSQENQIELARIAASIGVELFVVDDGWFGARRHDRAGLGDWMVSREVFPNGLRPLVDEVYRLGMKFGLWFEPEMVNPDSDLYRAHPDWVLHFPGRLRGEQRNQLILDLGRPEVVDHLRVRLDALVRENNIEFIKWDMNRYASQAGSVVGKAIWQRHVEGVYGLMDGLRRVHPALAIQTCSGGGGRIDLGILARTDQAWVSDNTDAHDRLLIQEGFSLAYPACVMESWVTEDKNPATGRPSSLDLRFDVAMRGVLGIGSRLNKLSLEELEKYRRKISFYKKIRPVVQEGELFRLNPLRLSGSAFSCWLTVLPDASRAIYSACVLGQMQGIHYPPQRLCALTPERVYAVVDEHARELSRYPGWQLMSLGLPGDQCFGGLGCATRSRTLLLEQVG